MFASPMTDKPVALRDLVPAKTLPIVQGIIDNKDREIERLKGKIEQLESHIALLETNMAGR